MGLSPCHCRSPNGHRVTNGGKLQVQAWTMEIIQIIGGKQWVVIHTVWRDLPIICSNRVRVGLTRVATKTCRSGFPKAKTATFEPKHAGQDFYSENCKFLVIRLCRAFARFAPRKSQVFILIWMMLAVTCHGDGRKQEWWASFKQG